MPDVQFASVYPRTHVRNWHALSRSRPSSTRGVLEAGDVTALQHHRRLGLDPAKAILHLDNGNLAQRRTGRPQSLAGAGVNYAPPGVRHLENVAKPDSADRAHI